MIVNTHRNGLITPEEQWSKKYGEKNAHTYLAQCLGLLGLSSITGCTTDWPRITSGMSTHKHFDTIYSRVRATTSNFEKKSQV